MISMVEILPRGSRRLLVEALGDTRVVLLLGARQVGKSTLAEEIVETDHPASSLSLDAQAPREAANSDPEGFIANLKRPVLIDEVQRGGSDLLLAIKSTVDKDPEPGQFFLTGSANLLTNRKVLDALTGRVEIITLWPLSQAEIERAGNNFVDSLFAGTPPEIENAPVGRATLIDRLAAGGYPEARLRGERSRDRWFASYVESSLGRDLEDISDAHKLREMPRLLRLLASRAANIVAPANISKDISLHRGTVEAYIGLLEAVFLVKRLPAWTPGIGGREIRHPKIYIVDTGLLLHLLGANEKRLDGDDQVTGRAIENFVAMEVLRHAEWSDRRPRLFHYRRMREEIDLVLEDRAGNIAAVEVKASASIQGRDWRSLSRLRDARSENFTCGVLLYTGENTVPLSDRIFAVPISGLWS
jgi:predicted AAA+ superfamily ATPase